MTVTGNVTFYVVLVISYFLKKICIWLVQFSRDKELFVERRRFSIPNVYLACPLG